MPLCAPIFRPLECRRLNARCVSDHPCTDPCGGHQMLLRDHAPQAVHSPCDQRYKDQAVLDDPPELMQMRRRFQSSKPIHRLFCRSTSAGFGGLGPTGFRARFELFYFDPAKRQLKVNLAQPYATFLGLFGCHSGCIAFSKTPILGHKTVEKVFLATKWQPDDNQKQPKAAQRFTEGCRVFPRRQPLEDFAPSGSRPLLHQDQDDHGPLAVRHQGRCQPELQADGVK